MATDPKLLSFKRLNLADLSFKQAEALAAYIRDTRPDPTQLLYSPMVAGLVITYMRPFVQSDGLGMLPDDFAIFPDQDLTDMHNQIKESRHKLYAHRDLRIAPTLATDDGSLPFEMRISFDDPHVSYTLAPGAIEISPSNMDQIIRLCKHQQAIVTQKLRPLVPILTNGKSYQPGTYTVGVDFP